MANYLTIQELEVEAVRKTFIPIFATTFIWRLLIAKLKRHSPFTLRQFKTVLNNNGTYLGKWNGRDCYIEVVKQ